ncbi:uncharacterized protein [Physcomitrium patens]|uniref:uncharacterized protein n=1 Tax=Physcomitrium patens TaxID=3218 RepID=UPI000D15CC4F|nr:BTB/POZ domain-containing protein 6-like isoform X2 [Physcomitrium patens]|eukprot:XP_024377667.1 BTB/POZ domain-containing protein 6-like isoform X2 [Physcomitrella patens]
MLDNWNRELNYRKLMDGGRGAGAGDGAVPAAAAAEAVTVDLSMCNQCGNLIENTVTYCHACYDLRSESDFRNERRWRELEGDFMVVEADLHKERAATKRLEGALQSFRHMLLQGIHADVTIETGEFDRTPAHRAVLVSIVCAGIWRFPFLYKASRSPVFRAMFEHELKEKTCAHIHVADVSTPAMRALLLYLYTGDHDTKVMKEHGMALLTAAHKYDIPDLKRVCETAVANSVKPSNVIETLQQARLYDATWVKRACVDCIAQNLEKSNLWHHFCSLYKDPQHKLLCG